MNEKEIITNLVNSEEFPIIHNYISEPYEKTIEEFNEENQQLKEQLKQRDEVIDEVSKILKEWEKLELDDLLKAIKDTYSILTKYKVDNTNKEITIYELYKRIYEKSCNVPKLIEFNEQRFYWDGERYNLIDYPDDSEDYNTSLLGGLVPEMFLNKTIIILAEDDKVLGGSDENNVL